MSTTISVRLDKDLLRGLSMVEKRWQTDRSESIRRLLAEAMQSWKIKDTLDKLQQHRISIGKASKECGISLWEMLDLVRKHNIDWTEYSKEDLEKDLNALEGRT